MSARTGNDVLTLSGLARKKKTRKRAINYQSRSESSDSLAVKKKKRHQKVLVESTAVVPLLPTHSSDRDNSDSDQNTNDYADSDHIQSDYIDDQEGSSANSDEDDDEHPTATVSTSSKKRVHLQHFKSEWMMKFSWAKSSPLGPCYYTCTACSKTFKCDRDGITSLKRHAGRQKHLQNMGAVEGTMMNLFEYTKKKSSLEKLTRTLEIQVALFIVKHNLPFSIADDFVDLLKGITINAEIQKQLRCKRTKCTKLIQNVTGKFGMTSLVENLKNNLFSIVIDEATDLTVTKHLAVCVRHPTPGGLLLEVSDSFFALLKVTDSSSKGLFKLIEDFFNANAIPFTNNMIGFASDGANVMFGAHQSVVTEFKKRIPKLFVLKCICHSLDLAVSKATKKLPSYLEEMLVDIFFYLKYSPKRLAAIGELQQFLNVPEHKILQLHKVRWLSLESVVNRTLEQYEVLVKYFEGECSAKVPNNPQAIKSNEKAKRNLDRLKNPWTRIYLEFLSFILRLVVKRNTEFQSESPKIYTLHSKMSSFFRTVVSMYLTEEYVERTDIEFLQFQEKTTETRENWERLANIDIGPTAKADLHSLQASTQEKEMFRDTCRSFLIALAQQTYERFPFNSNEIKFLESISFVDPVNLKKTRDITIPAAFFGFDVEDVSVEFKKLKKMFANETETDPNKFWQKVSTSVHGDGSLEFPLILDIVRRIVLLPHTSADCERVFSQVAGSSSFAVISKQPVVQFTNKRQQNLINL